jgi:methylisocitrate lyase
MNKAAESVYKTLLADGDQKSEIDNMQTRMDLYDYLGYHDYEQKLDGLFSEGKNK